MPDASKDLLTDLLREVSRSFYLSLRVLPSSVRRQIGLAYLLARATDTIADTEIVPVEQRLKALEQLRSAILGTAGGGVALGELARHQGLPAERVLLERVGEALTVLRGLDSEDQQRVRDLLTTITGGQELDLRRFAGATEQNVIALKTDEELDDYTYRVAGCVGVFWTKMCRRHEFPGAKLDDARLLEDGVRFGKGLQLVNILRDLPRDLRQGRCYLPVNRLDAMGLRPGDLLDRANEERVRPLYNEWLEKAFDHLHAGWDYTCALPWGCVRVRLGCALPVLIGLETLKLLVAGKVLDSGQRIKVGRGQIRAIIGKTIFLYPLRGIWQQLGSRSTWCGQRPSPHKHG